MKNKKVFIIIGIIIMVLIALGLITGFQDSARVKNNEEPKFTLKIVTDGGQKITYWGLGYKIIRYSAISPNEPFKNSVGVKFGSWFMTYSKETANKEYMERNKQKIDENIVLQVKENTITTKGAIFIIKNTTDEEYIYGQPYTIEKLEDGNWKELETPSPLTWNAIAYTLKAGEEKELNIDWSLGYGELKSGTYRLIKNDIRKSNSPESRTYPAYAEFDIK